jgi:hypothetical protein
MWKTILVLFLLPFSSYGSEPDYDFIISYQNCKIMTADVFKSPQSLDSISVKTGDPVNAICKKTPIYKCSYTNKDFTKSFGDFEYQVLAENEYSLELVTNTRSSRIFISKKTGTVSGIENVALSSAPNLSGSKICIGRYVTKEFMRKLASENNQ